MTESDNLHDIRHLLALMVIPDSHHARVEVTGKRTMTPDEARAHAVEVLHAADEAEQNETLGDFGYAAGDSQRLGELYTLLEAKLGWGDDEQEVDGDYAARIRQVGKILRQKHMRVVVTPTPNPDQAVRILEILGEWTKRGWWYEVYEIRWVQAHEAIVHFSNPTQSDDGDDLSATGVNHLDALAQATTVMQVLLEEHPEKT